MRKEYPLVSCIILTYKKFQYLFDALSSVLMQNYPSIEIIISDDASGNFPYDEIKAFIKKNKNKNIKNIIIRIEKENVGTVKNYNNAIKQAVGEYIIAVSGDDKLYEVETVKKIVDKFLEKKVDVICCRRILCTEDLKPLGVIPKNGFMKEISKQDTGFKQYKALVLGRHYGMYSGSSTYYRRLFITERGFFDEHYRLLEDFVFYLQYNINGGKMEVAADIISIYYRAGGVSTAQVRNPLLKLDDERRFEVEVLPYLKYFPFWERRYLKFSFEYLCMGAENSSFFQKIRLLFKYLDAYLLSRYYKYYGKLFGMIRENN